MLAKQQMPLPLPLPLLLVFRLMFRLMQYVFVLKHTAMPIALHEFLFCLAWPYHFDEIDSCVWPVFRAKPQAFSLLDCRTIGLALDLHRNAEQTQARAHAWGDPEQGWGPCVQRRHCWGTLA